MLSCAVCGAKVPLNSKDCVNGHANDYPNVRAAKRAEETAALAHRVDLVRKTSKAAYTDLELEAFGQAAKGTQAVMARDLKALDAFVTRDNAMLTTYYKQVRSGARLPEENNWDNRRASLDSAVNPHIHEEIHFAALSLSGRAPSWFGRYHVTLKDDLIADRATVFEMNPFAFFKAYPTNYGEPVPAGYRAPWPDRHLLVEAKLGPEIRAGMNEGDFADLVLDDKGGTPDADFVEVHIFGNIHVNAVERVVAKLERGEKPIWNGIKKRLTSLGVQVEEQ